MSESINTPITLKTFEELVQVFLGSDQNDPSLARHGRQFAPGTYFIQFIPELQLVVYGEVLDPLKIEIEAGGSASNVAFIEALYEADHMKYVRFTRCFSELVPDGEYGDTHVARMNTKLSRREFRLAKKMGWPSGGDVSEVMGFRFTNPTPLKE